MNKILVFNVNWVGDVIFSTPIFNALKKAYPQAQVCCLAAGRVKEVLESCPFVDEVMVFDEKGKHRSLWGKLCLIRKLRRARFDAVFLLHRSWTRAVLVFLAGIPVRVGYPTKRRGVFLTHQVEELPDEPHRSDHYLQVIESFGVPVLNRATVLAVDPAAEKKMRDLLCASGIHDDDPLVVLNTGGNWDLKRWPTERFAGLAKQIAETWKVRVIIPGAAKDQARAAEICAAAGSGVFNLSGKTGLKELLALMKRAAVVVSADSGPLHMANSLGTTVIGLFGPTRPEITGPRGCGQVVVLQKDVGCNERACYNLSCPDNRCMTAVTIEDVMTVLAKTLPDHFLRSSRERK